MFSQFWKNGKARFAWKARPAPVFYLAMSLAALALALSALEAVLEWKIHRDPGYLILSIGTITILVVVLAPLWREIYRALCMDAERPCASCCENEPPAGNLLQKTLEEYAAEHVIRRKSGKYDEENY